jgi:hypothetical protein
MSQKSLKVFRVSGLVIQPTKGVWRISRGSPLSKEICPGEGKVFVVQGRGVEIELAYVKWKNGEADVRMRGIQGPDVLHRLRHGLRLGVSISRGTHYIDLRQACLGFDTDQPWSNLHAATEEELNSGAGVDVRRALRRAGATHVGTKSGILGTKDNTRGRQCATFSGRSDLVPVVAYVMTRVLPLLRASEALGHEIAPPVKDAIACPNTREESPSAEQGKRKMPVRKAACTADVLNPRPGDPKQPRKKLLLPGDAWCPKSRSPDPNMPLESLTSPADAWGLPVDANRIADAPENPLPKANPATSLPATKNVTQAQCPKAPSRRKRSMNERRLKQMKWKEMEDRLLRSGLFE